MNSKSNGLNLNVGFLGILGLIFITLKLTDVISWSWWFVLMPIYIPFAALILLAIVLLVVIAVESR